MNPGYDWPRFREGGLYTLWHECGSSGGPINGSLATIAVHKSFGVASAAHFAPNTYKLSWPSHEMGALPVEGGVAVAFHREIAAAEDPDEKRRELEQMLMKDRSPFPMMESFAVHELIDPRGNPRQVVSLGRTGSNHCWKN